MKNKEFSNGIRDLPPKNLIFAVLLYVAKRQSETLALTSNAKGRKDRGPFLMSARMKSVNSFGVPPTESALPLHAGRSAARARHMDFLTFGPFGPTLSHPQLAGSGFFILNSHAAGDLDALRLGRDSAIRLSVRYPRSKHRGLPFHRCC